MILCFWVVTCVIAFIPLPQEVVMGIFAVSLGCTLCTNNLLLVFLIPVVVGMALGMLPLPLRIITVLLFSTVVFVFIDDKDRL
jgi:hypothetical protein